MKLSQLYAIMGWLLRFWRTKTLPPQPPAHNIKFTDAVRIAGGVANMNGADEAPKPAMTDEEFKEKCRAMDARYSSLKQGESLGKLSPEELRELHCMETGHGWCLDLQHERHERLGMRICY